MVTRNRRRSQPTGRHGAGSVSARSRRARRLQAQLACGAAGGALFVSVFLVESLLHPSGYHPLRHTVSAYVLGPYG